MTERVELFRLPLGGTTTDRNEYGRAWIDLGDKIAKFFPGYEASGFDPDIQLVAHNSRPYSDYITLTIPAVKALLAGGEQLLKAQERIKELEELLDKAVHAGIDGALGEVRRQGGPDYLLKEARGQGLRDAEFCIKYFKKVIE